MAPTSTDLVLGRGVVLEREHVVLSCFDPDLDPSINEEQPTLILDWYNGRVGSTTISWHVVALAQALTPRPHVVLLGRSGQAAVWVDATTAIEIFDQSDEGPPGRGVMRDLARIDGTLWAVGMSRQAYRRSVLGPDPIASSWERLHDAILPPLDAPLVYGFDAVDGFTADDVYAVGWQGEIWRFSQSGWQSLPSPTNLGLERVVCAPDGQVYVAGQRGVLLRGRGARWEIIPQTATEDTIRGLAWFAGQLWAATGTAVFRLDGDDLAPVALEADDLTARWLTAAGGQLWSIGSQHVFRTDDGARWTQLVLQS